MKFQFIVCLKSLEFSAFIAVEPSVAAYEQCVINCHKNDMSIYCHVKTVCRKCHKSRWSILPLVLMLTQVSMHGEYGWETGAREFKSCAEPRFF